MAYIRDQYLVLERKKAKKKSSRYLAIAHSVTAEFANEMTWGLVGAGTRMTQPLASAAPWEGSLLSRFKAGIGIKGLTLDMELLLNFCCDNGGEGFKIPSRWMMKSGVVAKRENLMEQSNPSCYLELSPALGIPMRRIGLWQVLQYE